MYDGSRFCQGEAHHRRGCGHRRTRDPLNSGARRDPSAHLQPRCQRRHGQVLGDGQEREDLHLVVVTEGRRLRRDREVQDGQGCSIGQVQGEHIDQGEVLRDHLDRARQVDDGRSLEGRRGWKERVEHHDNVEHFYDYVPDHSERA